MCLCVWWAISCIRFVISNDDVASEILCATSFFLYNSLYTVFTKLVLITNNQKYFITFTKSQRIEKEKNMCSREPIYFQRVRNFSAWNISKMASPWHFTLLPLFGSLHMYVAVWLVIVCMYARKNPLQKVLHQNQTENSWTLLN